MLGFDKLLIVPVITIFLTFSYQASARFLENDSMQIDQEERLGLETYNDLISYRYPVQAWLDWFEYDTGFRANAGSLNANRFLYTQDIKFSTNRGQSGSFGFTQYRVEDIASQRDESEIRATFMPFGAVEFSVLGDSSTFKEFGDLGFAIGIFRDRQHWIEFFYWSVDHYYDTKKSDALDSRNRRAWSAGLRETWVLNSEYQLQSFFEYEVPLIWKRASRGFNYEYQRRSASLRLIKGQKNDGLYELSLAAESKFEAKDWREYSALALEEYRKELHREVLTANLAWFKTGADADHEIGGILISRRANYKHVMPNGVATESPEANDLEEKPSPDSGRFEQGVYGSVNRPIGESSHHRFQYGAHANNVFIDERDGYRNVEVKFQAAWEYRYNAKASAILNTSWDVDQLVADFPYQEGNFRPWGGGNIQFTAVF